MEDINYVDHVDPEPKENSECCGDPEDCHHAKDGSCNIVKD